MGVPIPPYRLGRREETILKSFGNKENKRKTKGKSKLDEKVLRKGVQNGVPGRGVPEDVGPGPGGGKFSKYNIKIIIRLINTKRTVDGLLSIEVKKTL